MGKESENPQNVTPNRKGLLAKVELGYDSIFEVLSLTILGNHLKGEIRSIRGIWKKAPIFVIISVFVLGYSLITGWQKSSKIQSQESKINSLNEQWELSRNSQSVTIANLSSGILTNSITLENLKSKLTEEEAEIQKLTSERDAARNQEAIAKNALASWELLAKSADTNTPLTERLDVLITKLNENNSSLTNLMTLPSSLRSSIYDDITNELLTVGDLNRVCILPLTNGGVSIFGFLSHPAIQSSAEFFIKDAHSPEQPWRPEIINNMFYGGLINFDTNNLTVAVKYAINRKATDILVLRPEDATVHFEPYPGKRMFR